MTVTYVRIHAYMYNGMFDIECALVLVVGCKIRS